MVKEKPEMIKCPECSSGGYTAIGIRWRKKIKWSREIGNRIKIRKVQCKNCGRYYSVEIKQEGG